MRWGADPVDVPTDHWYVLADDRDYTMDSRQWGPVPTAALAGVVRLRLGAGDQWRPPVEWLTGTE